MPNTVCSHNDNRAKVCAPCGRKIAYGKIKPAKFLITERIENLIKEFISKDFDLTDEKYPLSICRSCYLTLIDFEKEIYNRQLPSIPDYDQLVVGKTPRSNKGFCTCYICETATFKGHIKTKSGRGKFREVNKEIDISAGFHEAML